MGREKTLEKETLVKTWDVMICTRLSFGSRLIVAVGVHESM